MRIVFWHFHTTLPKLKIQRCEEMKINLMDSQVLTHFEFSLEAVVAEGKPLASELFTAILMNFYWRPSTTCRLFPP